MAGGSAAADLRTFLGPDDDTIVNGNETPRGGDGDDRQRGDIVSGDQGPGRGTGVNTVVLGNGDLQGRDGNDDLVGDGAADRENVSGGADVLRCGDGVDSADGGPGSDRARGCETVTDVEATS